MSKRKAGLDSESGETAAIQPETVQVTFIPPGKTITIAPSTTLLDAARRADSNVNKI